MAKHKAQQSGFPLWAAVLIYILLSVLMTWPLAGQLNSHVPTPDNDVFNVYWGNWWVRHALATGQNPYLTDYLLYPVGFDLVSFAFSPFLALLWTPLSWVLPPLAAYNLVLLLTIVLSCLAMDQLVRYLTGNPWAALVAGITFGFAPPIVAERLPHLNLSALFWIPWAALLLTRLMRQARMRDALLLAVVAVLAFLTRLHVGVLLVLFCVVYWIGLALVEAKSWSWLAVRRLLLAGAISLLLLGPLFIFAWQSLRQPGGEALLRGGAEIHQTDLLAYVLPPQQHPLFGSWTAATYEGRFEVNRQYWAYLGLIPLLLVVYAAITRLRASLPWLLAGSFFFVLALGPVLRLNGQVYPAVKLPFGLAPDLFSAIGFNWPNRFNLALMVAVSALVGLACDQIYARARKGWLLGLVALLIVGEYLLIPLPTIFPPPDSAFYEQLAADGEAYALVDLPLTRHDGEVYRYFQTLHEKPIVGGWDHRVPESGFAFIAANPLLASWMGDEPPELALDQALAGLAAANVRYIVIHKPQLATIPESLRPVLGTLRPAYQDWSILALPVSSPSAQGYNVVQRFGEDLALIRPTAYLRLPWDGRPPILSLYLCWLRSGQGTGADGYRLALTGPDGAPAYEGAASLPAATQGLVCQIQSLEIDPPAQAGTYEVRITPSAEGQPLGTYRSALPIHVLQTRAGDRFAAMGYDASQAYEAPLELEGYHLTGGEGYLWVDLFWRSTARHEHTYPLSVTLLAAEGGARVASSEGNMDKIVWRKGDLFQERRILWLDGLAPGAYRVGVTLQDARPLNPESGQPLPEEGVVLDVPVQILFPGAEGVPGAEGTPGIVAYPPRAPGAP